MRDLGQQENKCHHLSALDAVLRALCPAHRTLLHQFLKQACQEQILPFRNHRPGKTEFCCHCDIKKKDDGILFAFKPSQCKGQPRNLCCPLMGCNHQGHGSTTYHSGAPTSNCKTNLYPLNDCKIAHSLGSNCCVQKCKTEIFTVPHSKLLHCLSCQTLEGGHKNHLMCSITPSSTLSKSPSLYSPSCNLYPSALICCNQHSCLCYTKSGCPLQIRTPIERGAVDWVPPCIESEREQSPSPPPLSPIPSDFMRKTDEKPPPLLHHGQDDEAETSFKETMRASPCNTSEKRSTHESLKCSTPTISGAKQNSHGSLLQDVVDRFSEKLETIKPLENGSPLVSAGIYAREKEESPSSSQNLQSCSNAHLTEIITKVLHKNTASDYSLSELFYRHDSKEPKSPNTRFRRRQEVLTAIATPTDNSSTRRQSLKIKRELAMFDQSYTRRKLPAAKRAKVNDEKVTLTVSCTSLDSNTIKEKIEEEMEESDMLSEKLKSEIQAVVITEEILNIKAEENTIKMSDEEKNTPTNTQTLVTELSSQTASDEKPAQVAETPNSVNHCMETCIEKENPNSSTTENGLKNSQSSREDSDGEKRLGVEFCSLVEETKKHQSKHSNEVRRSRRNIVPPQRFSSYVVEPINMFFVPCFSGSISNPKTQNITTASTLDGGPRDTDTDAKEPQLETSAPMVIKEADKLLLESTHGKEFPVADAGLETKPTTQKSPAKQRFEDGKNLVVNTVRSLRSSPRLKVSLAASRTPNIPLKDKVIASTPNENKSPNVQFQYTSPIKLMFFSEVKDKGEIKYSLKSANGGSSSHTEEPFDLFGVSPWSEATEKHGESTSSPTSKVKLTASPLKPSTSPVSSSVKSPPLSPKSSPRSKSLSCSLRSASSPTKPSPSESVFSLRSVSSSPKVGSRRSSENTPTKQPSAPESQRSPRDSSVNEATPPKRRPGRPKKLGPQLEQKVKRPIGRPRKQKTLDAETGQKLVDGKPVLASDPEENANKNLKITVLYGRSRRNKRMVSEGMEELQTEFHDPSQAVGLKGDCGILLHSSKTSTGHTETTKKVPSLDCSLSSPLKESASLSGSHIKCTKQDESGPSKKPGRPAKVKISGISVTVTTVSPRQRKIQMNRDAGQSPATLTHKKVFLPEFKTAKEHRTIICQSTNRERTEKELETKIQSEDKQLDLSVPVRHSMRVKKPSIHFLHAVAMSTSRSYRHSNALLRRSKQLLLNKASNDKRKEEQQQTLGTFGGKKPLQQEKGKKLPKDLSRVAEVSVNSIFSPKKSLRWWAVSAEQNTINQEFARRIQRISDTWVSGGVENQENEVACDSKFNTKCSNSLTRKSKHSSVVRTLFDCSPNKPRSCSMQQLCSWFMQTTETQSLAIVKKASLRNPYEEMHFPRSTSNKGFCQSPQAERLRKHVKKFAKTVPKSPLQHQLAQRRMDKKNEAPAQGRQIRRQLFPGQSTTNSLKQGVQLQRRIALRNHQIIVRRAKRRFLTQKERQMWQKRQRAKKTLNLGKSSKANAATGLRQKRETVLRSVKYQSSNSWEKYSTKSSLDQIQEPVKIPKEQNLSSKAWSPETIKECRVFLRKINSPDNESPEEEWNSCTVTLDDGSPPAFVYPERGKELKNVVKAVKMEKTSPKRRTSSRELTGSALESVAEQDAVSPRRRKGKHKSPESLSTDTAQPPPAKKLRQSRIRSFTGPKWCDFVVGN